MRGLDVSVRSPVLFLVTNVDVCCFLFCFCRSRYTPSVVVFVSVVLLNRASFWEFCRDCIDMNHENGRP